MKVSIIIPAYNEESYIGGLLSALTHTDYPDYEIIVVDNSSTDKTADIARSFPQVKVVSETRRGTQAARERGRKEATGEILACLDADCVPNATWLSRAVSLLIKKDAVVVTGPLHYYDGPFYFRWSSLILQQTAYFVIHNFLQLTHTGAIMLGCNCLIKAQALQDIGGFDTSILFYGDDTDTGRRLSKVGHVVFSNRLLMNTSSRRFKKFGIFHTFSMYILNFVWEIVFKRPFKNTYDSI